jgi:hypothetical protein
MRRVTPRAEEEDERENTGRAGVDISCFYGTRRGFGVAGMAQKRHAGGTGARVAREYNYSYVSGRADDPRNILCNSGKSADSAGRPAASNPC